MISLSQVKYPNKNPNIFDYVYFTLNFSNYNKKVQN